MRIGINALFLQKPVVAAGLHLLHLLEGSGRLRQAQQYVLLSPRFRQRLSRRACRSFPRSLPQRRGLDQVARLGENVEKLWWEQSGLVQAATREKIDLLHCPYFAAPLSDLPDRRHHPRRHPVGAAGVRVARRSAASTSAWSRSRRKRAERDHRRLGVLQARHRRDAAASRPSGST